MNKKYLIEINYTNGKNDQIELTTDDLEWSMEQYQRNRDFLTWEIIE